MTRWNNSLAAPLPVPSPYTINFEQPPTAGRPKRYLLRVVNTSFESNFIFSIDNHVLQVVGADFVPIKPYNTTSIMVAIGQRYHVIVTAQPQADGGPLPEDGNFWIRTWRGNCFRFNPAQGDPGYELAGILRYGSSESLPTTTEWPVDLTCSDEPYDKLVPMVPWQVGKAANDPTGQLGENLTVQINPSNTYYPLATFSIGGEEFNPLYVDYGDPTVLNLNNTGKWNPLWVVFPENYTDTDWVYLAMKGLASRPNGAHPIHLHGHDFAILQTNANATYPEGLDLKFDNPPRRDVVFLPARGYVVIAFKTDNPGTWLMHCHIADHAALGLAMQIVERQGDASDIWPSVQTSPVLETVDTGCKKWNQWWEDCHNWWPGDGSSCGIGEDGASPDSGI